MKAARKAFDEYREVYRRTKPAGPKPHIGLMREIYVAESDRASARRRRISLEEFLGAARRRAHLRRARINWTIDDSRRQPPAELMDMEHSIAEGSFICGAPDTVVEQIKTNRQRRRRRHLSR